MAKVSPEQAKAALKKYEAETLGDTSPALDIFIKWLENDAGAFDRYVNGNQKSHPNQDIENFKASAASATYLPSVSMNLDSSSIIQLAEPGAKMAADNVFPGVKLNSIGEQKNKQRLFLGEADFSYTLALINKHQKILLGPKIIATAYENEKELSETYNHFSENVQILKKKGVNLRFNIDATKLAEIDEFKDKRFKRIQFNCPHDKSNFENGTLPKMILNFFKSAEKLQRIGDKIQIALPKPETIEKMRFYYGFVYSIYDAARNSGYILDKKRQFGANRYNGYQHRITGEDSSASVTKALREYIFVKTDKNSEEILELSKPVKHKVYGKDCNSLPEINTDTDSSDYLDSEADLDYSEEDTQHIISSLGGLSLSTQEDKDIHNLSL